MRRFLYAFAIAALVQLGFHAAVPPTVRAQPSPCGTGRWGVKTLSDPDAGNVDLTQVIGVNISTLAAIPVPDPAPDQGRYDPLETTIYTTTADLVEARLQPDHDIVVVLQDPISGDTMTAAFPDAAQCAAGADAKFMTLMEQARNAFVQAFGMPGTAGFTPLSGFAQITGIGFFDPVQGQHGEAPNGFELHPVLDFRTDAGTGAGAAGAVGVSAQGATVVQPALPAMSATAVTPASPAQSSSSAVPHRYYVDTAGSAGAIYCDNDPALPFAGRRNLVAFRSLDLALAAFPGYRLNRPC